jgi:glyoxylase-like metal-dependent hydrolase (beta-lactamase superfamily II)
MLPEYELYAIRYATRAAKRSQHFIGGDPHDGPMPMDYFTWVIKGAHQNFVVDSGFTAEIAAQRARQHLRCPVDTMRHIGLGAETVTDVILTHLHYDHVGNFHKFPSARFHLQESEMAFATGRHMRYPALNRSFEIEDVVGIVRLNFADRVVWHRGDAELAPGVSVHLAPGHTAGLQIVRVHTRRGWVVLASDASHFYENMRRNRPYATVFHVGDMVDSYRVLERLADSPRHIVPGHDPLVMQEYPAPAPSPAGVDIRLDVEPVAIA